MGQFCSRDTSQLFVIIGCKNTKVMNVPEHESSICHVIRSYANDNSMFFTIVSYDSIGNHEISNSLMR